ncbi:MAG: Ig-like domain-containing protein [Clostridiales bacterium]|nr:Ig-like domain-containing protein [Clostridiales bacterium]
MKKVGILFLLLCLVFGTALADGLTVRFFSIDRNDGILLECDGETAFLDSGTHDYGLKAVSQMRESGVEKLTYYVGTHAHKDHVGGGSAILAAMHPSEVLQPHDGVRRRILSCAQTKEEREAAEAAAYRTVYPGEEIPLGGATMTVLGPLRLREPNKISDMENNNSLVLRVVYGRRTFLLTADAMPEEISEIAAVSGELFACDVLKSPHHNGETGDELLKLASPRYVVFSTSDKAMPTKVALSSVTAADAVPLITAEKQCGTVTVWTDGETLTVSVENEPEKIAFQKKELSLSAGKKKKLAAETKPAGYKAIHYVSDNPEIAEIDGQGAVHGRMPGETVVRAVLPGGRSAECHVTVMPVSLSLNVGEITLNPGGTRQLRLKVQPSDLKTKVRWESDNPAVAKVGSTGVISAVTPGTATIRVKAPGGAEATCLVRVK